MAASWRAAGLVLMAALAGCTSPETPRPAYVPSKPESFAQQIMNAADFVALRNADSPDGLRWAPGSGAGRDAVTAAGFGIARALSEGLGTGLLSGIAMAGSPSGGVTNEGQYRTFLAWVPKEQAHTPEDAAQLFAGHIEDAYLQAITSMDLRGANVDISGRERNPQSYRISLGGGPCTGAILCAINMSSGGNPDMFVSTRAPVVLGGYDSWGTFRTSLKGVSSSLSSDGYRRFALLPEYELLRAVSARLPSWILIYIPARAVSTCLSPSEPCRWNEEGVLLQQGVAHRFVTPSTAVQASAVAG